MKVPVHNHTEMPIYVGVSMILPGETRHFDPQDVPHHMRPSEEEIAALEDPMAELAGGTVADAVARIPTLSLPDLERLGELEQTGKARVTLLSAIAEEILNREQDARLGELITRVTEELIAVLPTLSDVEVARATEMEQGGQARPALLEALAAEQIKRQG